MYLNLCNLGKKYNYYIKLNCTLP